MAAREQFDRAIPVLRQSGPINQAVHTVSLRGVFHSFYLEHDQADHDLEWAYGQAAELGLGFDLLVARFHQARTRGNQGRLSEAWETLDDALRSAELLATASGVHALRIRVAGSSPSYSIPSPRFDWIPKLFSWLKNSAT